MGALRGARRSSSAGFRDGRKSILFVSEGFTVMLPPQMRRANAQAPPSLTTGVRGPAHRETWRRCRASWISTAGCARSIGRPIATTPRSTRSTRVAWPPSSSTSRTAPSAPSDLTEDAKMLRCTQETLRTSGRGDRRPRHRQSQHAARGADADGARLERLLPARLRSRRSAADGKFHEIKVRVKRSGDRRAGAQGLLGADAAESRGPNSEGTRTRQADAERARHAVHLGAGRAITFAPGSAPSGRPGQDARDARVGAVAGPAGRPSRGGRRLAHRWRIRERSRSSAAAVRPGRSLAVGRPPAAASAPAASRRRRLPRRRPRSASSSTRRPGKLDLRMTVEAAAPAARSTTRRARSTFRI